MTNVDIMTVYCDGPPDNAGRPSHQREVIAQYKLQINKPAGRPRTRQWIQLEQWSYGGRSGRTRNWGGEHYLVNDAVRQGQPGDTNKWQRTLNWKCPRCGLDEQRTHAKSDVSARLWQAFDGLAAAGQSEISARALITRVLK